MRRLTILLIAAAFILLPLQDALAHGGGLNSQGCHNETATGGYHCHRDRDDDKDDWETAGAILGGLLSSRAHHLHAQAQASGQLSWVRARDRGRPGRQRLRWRALRRSRLVRTAVKYRPKLDPKVDLKGATPWGRGVQSVSPRAF